MCVYHGESNSVVVCGGRTVGMRRDHHGVLLLATVLQGPVSAPEETVTVEMLLSEVKLISLSVACLRPHRANFSVVSFIIVYCSEYTHI